MADIRKRLQIPTDVLGDICSRFLLNIPKSEKDEMVRLCFQIELAHWFYLDFYRAEDSKLPDCKIRDFAKLIFEEFPFLLKPAGANVEQVLDEWRDYKHSVPTYGAALFDSSFEYVLLVQGILANSSWGFPKGKVNKDEAPAACAVREVMEETGFNIKLYMDEELFIELYIHEQLTRLYIVVNVPMETKFQPQTRGEIGSVKWFAMSDLPEHKKDQTPKQNLNMNPNNFFMVIPFVKQLRKCINSMKNAKKSNKTAEYHSFSARNTPKRNRNETQKKSRVQIDSPNPNAHKNAQKNIEKDAYFEEQRRQFRQANYDHFENIMKIKNDKSSPLRQSSSATDKAQNGNAGIGRGRSLSFDFKPEIWKNFKFDCDAIIGDMDKILNKGKSESNVNGRYSTTK